MEPKLPNQSQTQDEAQIDCHQMIFKTQITSSNIINAYGDKPKSNKQQMNEGDGQEEEEDEELEEGLRTPSAVSPRQFPICPESPLNDETVHNQNDHLLILLDWDDTLFPTSVIVEILKNRDRNGFALVSDENIALLDKLGALTLNLLIELINKYGANNIYIVTNSLEGWIANSLAFAACISKIYKEIETLLQNNNITMQSAQTMYAHKCNVISDNNCNNNLETVQANPIIWKQLCFTQILNAKETKPSYKHIISIGDQWTDHHSVKQSINALETYSPIHHMIKLKMVPNLNDMMNEVLYVQTCFDQIFSQISVDNSQCIQPVIIDYYREEIKHYNNCTNNINVNVNNISK